MLKLEIIAILLAGIEEPLIEFASKENPTLHPWYFITLVGMIATYL